MTLKTRLPLYQEVERLRGRPLIVYVTSNRQNALGEIASDSVAELLTQLQALPKDTSGIDLLIVSNGGDPTVAWRIVSLIRETAKEFSVIVPQAAYSAATLIVLGADEVIMHPHGNLGPTDPQIRPAKRPGKDGGMNDSVHFGAEDLAAFLRFSKETVGLTDQREMLAVYGKFCDEVGTVAIGVAARSTQLSVRMGEKLLQLHMTADPDQQRARVISEKLTKDFFHHGYPVNRTEAREIGLKVAASDPTLERLMWEIWSDISEELKLREPFNAVNALKSDPNCAPLFGPSIQVTLPANLPPQVAQQAYQAILANIPTVTVPPVAFELIHAIMESSRCSSRFVTRGSILGSRGADLQLRIANVVDFQGWVTHSSPPIVATPTVGAPPTGMVTPAAKRAKKRTAGAARP